MLSSTETESSPLSLTKGFFLTEYTDKLIAPAFTTNTQLTQQHGTDYTSLWTCEK